MLFAVCRSGPDSRLQIENARVSPLNILQFDYAPENTGDRGTTSTRARGLKLIFATVGEVPASQSGTPVQSVFQSHEAEKCVKMQIKKRKILGTHTVLWQNQIE